MGRHWFQSNCARGSGRDHSISKSLAALMLAFAATFLIAPRASARPFRYVTHPKGSGRLLAAVVA